MRNLIQRPSQFFRALGLVALVWGANAPAMDEVFIRCIVEFRLVSQNASVPPKAYRQFATRDLRDLDGSIHPGFGEGLLQRNDLAILDVGGGYSLYGVQLANAGHRVETINAQDFYGETLYPLGTEENALAFYRGLPKTEEGTYLITDTTVGLPLMRHLSSVLDIPLPRSIRPGQKGQLYFPTLVTETQAAKELADFFSMAKTKLEKVEKEKTFKRYSKLAQDRMPEIASQSKDVIIDSFGAFYYSTDRFYHPERPSLLAQYYRVLRPGGKAKISVSVLVDTIKLPDGREVDLYDFLAQAVPQIFQVSRHNGTKTLTMTRTSDPEAVNAILKALGNPLITQEEEGGDSPIYPNNQFTLVFPH